MKNLNGFLLIDKPAGWTSFDVCAKLRKPLGVKRIGHTGTLDPFATGLLVIAVGKCTKLIPMFEKDQKSYRTEILLGKNSDTLDPESEIENSHDGRIPDLAEIESILTKKFTGKIEQIPPKYSALKIDGKRAYDLAREGKAVEMKSRETEVLSVEVVDYDFPELTIDLTVAAGFYVRSFARDLGAVLCGGGICQTLRRTRVGDLDLENTDLGVVINLDEVTSESLIDPQLLIKNIVHLNIDSDRLPDLEGGRAVMLESPPENGQKVLIICEAKTVGLGEIINGNLQPRAMF